MSTQPTITITITTCTFTEHGRNRGRHSDRDPLSQARQEGAGKDGDGLHNTPMNSTELSESKQVIELMKRIVDGVMANEMGALQYEMFEDLQTQDICFVEKYYASFSLQGGICLR